MPDLAFADQLLHRAGDVLHRHVRIHTVLIEKVGAVRLEPPQRCFGDPPDALRPAVHPFCRIAVLEPEFRSNDDLVPQWRERLSDGLLVRERTIGFRGVDLEPASSERSLFHIPVLH